MQVSKLYSSSLESKMVDEYANMIVFTHASLPTQNTLL